MNIKDKIEQQKKESEKLEKEFKDGRKDFFKQDEKMIQKTLYINENLDKALKMHNVLNGENNSETMRKALEEYLNKFENIKEFLKRM